MSRLGGAASQFYSLGRSKPKIASLSFWRPLRDSCRVAVVEPPVPYLESTAAPPGGGPARKTSQLGLPAVLVIGSPTVYLLHHLRRTAIVMPRQKVTADGLDARTEANGYQRGAHWEEDRRRDSNKHEDKTKKNYRAKLVRNLYNGSLRTLREQQNQKGYQVQVLLLVVAIPTWIDLDHDRGATVKAKLADRGSKHPTMERLAMNDAATATA